MSCQPDHQTDRMVFEHFHEESMTPLTILLMPVTCIERTPKCQNNMTGISPALNTLECRREILSLSEQEMYTLSKTDEYIHSVLPR